MMPVLSVVRHLKIIRSKYRVKCVTFLTLMCFSLHSYATCIFVVTTPTSIYLAADSLQASGLLPARYRCKIEKDRGFYWTAATEIFIDTVTGYDVRHLVKRVKYHGRLMDKMRAFIDSAKAPMAAELSTFKQNDPVTYKELVGTKGALAGTSGAFMEVVFVGTEKDHPIFVSVNLIAREVNGSIVIDGSPTLLSYPKVIALGDYSDAGFPYLVSQRKRLPTDTTQVLIESIEAQEAAMPKFVGGKVSVLRIDADGAHWEAKGECQ